MAMSRTVVVCHGDYLTARRRGPSFHGKTKLKPGPRKNEPMMTSTAQNIRKMREQRDGELAVLGLVARVAVGVGRQDQRERGPCPG